MKGKRMLALLLAMTMCLSLSACGKSGEEQSSAAQESEVAEESGDDESQADSGKNYWEMLDEVSDTSELPDWEGEILEANVWFAFGTDFELGEIYDSNLPFKEVERVTGVRFVSDESFSNKGDSVDAAIPKLVASDGFPTYVKRLEQPTTVGRTLYDNGYLVDLTEYIEKGWLDQVEKWVPREHFDSAWAKCRTEDGKYYMIPDPQNLLNYYQGAGYDRDGLFDVDYYNNYVQTPFSASGVMSMHTVYVREDILKEMYPDVLSMDEIKQIYVEEGEFTEEQIFDVPLSSKDDFFSMLRDVKGLLDSGNYTGLDGKEMEVTYGPNTDLDAWQLMDALPKMINGFGIGANYVTMMDRNAENESDLFVRSIDNDVYKEWIKDLNTLVNEDVIAKNSFVDNAAAFNEKIRNGHYAVIYGGSIDTFAFTIDGGDWVYRPVWIKEEVNPNFGGTISEALVYASGIFNKDYTEEQIEQLVHCVNYLYSEVGVHNFITGPESAGLVTVNEDGTRTITEEGFAIMQDANKAVEYGVYNLSTESASGINFWTYPQMDEARNLVTYKYTNGVNRADRNPENAYAYYNPGNLPGWSQAENADVMKTEPYAYSAGLVFEEWQKFMESWSGFNNQMIKVIAASTENFDKEYNNLIQFCDENYLTEENVQLFNDWFVEQNREQLEAAGIID